MQNTPTGADNNSSSSNDIGSDGAVAAVAAVTVPTGTPSAPHPSPPTHRYKRSRSRSRSRTRTRDFPSSPAKSLSSAEASGHPLSESTTDGGVDALKCHLQHDINKVFAWKQGITHRLEGQNRKIDVLFTTANEGVRIAKLADVSAGDAMTRADDAMKQAEEALKRAKNVFNTTVNEHGPRLRQVKDRVTDLEKKVDDLERDTRSMSRTLVSGSNGSSGSSSRSGDSILDVRSDMRTLQRVVHDMKADMRHSTQHSASTTTTSAVDVLNAKVELLIKELASEKAKVNYLMQRDHDSSYGRPSMQQLQQPPIFTNANYLPLPYPPPPTTSHSTTTPSSASLSSAVPSYYTLSLSSASQHARMS